VYATQPLSQCGQHKVLAPNPADVITSFQVLLSCAFEFP
jgi:hypothetical protein